MLPSNGGLTTSSDWPTIWEANSATEGVLFVFVSVVINVDVISVTLGIKKIISKNKVNLKYNHNKVKF